MKIGILTFHWATNYGAVLQAYALQHFLEGEGHSVEIIDYKPAVYDLSLHDFFRRPRNSVKRLFAFRLHRKSRLLQAFRSERLHLTHRCYTAGDVASIADRYDCLISGSDQILNPSFTMCGEGKPTSTYFLNFVTSCRKVGYAVSFGCTAYPTEAAGFASDWIRNFDAVGVREESGLDILRQLGYQNPVSLVPDPTLLLGRTLFSGLIAETRPSRSFVFVYLLRGVQLSPQVAHACNLPVRKVAKSASLQEWLGGISGASLFLTNSYHGIIMALMLHVRFVAILETGKLAGMNDRFRTLLGKAGLTDCISENIPDSILEASRVPIDWDRTDALLETWRRDGKTFLHF